MNSVVILLERAPSVVRTVDIDKLDLPRELLLQCLQFQHVVPEDEPVVEEVVVADPLHGMIRLLGVFEKDTGLEPGAVFLADPGQFQLDLPPSLLVLILE
jgi:hypothetical protein